MNQHFFDMSDFDNKKMPNILTRKLIGMSDIENSWKNNERFGSFYTV